MFKLMLLAQVASTLFMVGLIWMVQVVHYPLFNGVGQAEFAAYENRHARAITWIVLPAMTVELLTAIGLLVLRPAGGGLAASIPGWTMWAGLIAVLLLWLITFAFAVPQHTTLAKGFDADAHRALVNVNWLRTGLWTLRGGLVLAMLACVMRGDG